MKKILFSIYFCLALLAMNSRLAAQVTGIGQFKVTVYDQTNASPPAAPNYPTAYYFAVTFNSDPNFTIFPPTVFTPALTTNTSFTLATNGPDFYYFGSPYYPDKADFDADFPNGLYDYSVSYQDQVNTNNIDEEDMDVQVPATDLYSTTVPALTPDCWTAIQLVDPSADFPLSWAGYTITPGADFADTFVGANDSISGDAAFNYSFDSDTTSTTIPAGTLEYGRTYAMQLFYSMRVGTDLGNGDNMFAGVTVGFDDLTLVNFATIAPCLQISRANPGVTLTWPALATNYKLQYTHNLTMDCWYDSSCTPTVNGSSNTVTVSADHDATFFRLRQF